MSAPIRTDLHRCTTLPIAAEAATEVSVSTNVVPITTNAPSDSGALMQIIARAATDQQYDVAKLQALLAVKKEWEADEARSATSAPTPTAAGSAVGRSPTSSSASASTAWRC